MLFRYPPSAARVALKTRWMRLLRDHMITRDLWCEGEGAGPRKPEAKGAPMGTQSVVVAGRRPAMLRSLKRVIEPEFEVAAMADNVLSMLDALEEIDPDLLVLDTGSAEFGTGDLARRLHERHPQLRILLVGDADDGPPCSARCPRVGYVSKSAADSALIPAARALLAQTPLPTDGGA